MLNLCCSRRPERIDQPAIGCSASPVITVGHRDSEREKYARFSFCQRSSSVSRRVVFFAHWLFPRHHGRRGRGRRGFFVPPSAPWCANCGLTRLATSKEFISNPLPEWRKS